MIKASKKFTHAKQSFSDLCVHPGGFVEAHTAESPPQSFLIQGSLGVEPDNLYFFFLDAAGDLRSMF